MNPNVLLVYRYLFAFQYLLCFVHSQGHLTKEIENKNIHKEAGKFPNQSHSINYGLNM